MYIISKNLKFVLALYVLFLNCLTCKSTENDKYSLQIVLCRE